MTFYKNVGNGSPELGIKIFSLLVISMLAYIQKYKGIFSKFIRAVWLY